jgi:hypothetical protein
MLFANKECIHSFNMIAIYRRVIRKIANTSLNNQNFGINYSLEIDEIADFDINLDCLNDISFCENEANGPSKM